MIHNGLMHHAHFAWGWSFLAAGCVHSARNCALCKIVSSAILFPFLRRFTPKQHSTPLYAVSRETALLLCKICLCKKRCTLYLQYRRMLICDVVSHETILELSCESLQMFHVKQSCASQFAFYRTAQLYMQNLSISPAAAQIEEKFAIFLVFPQKSAFLCWLFRLALL